MEGGLICKVCRNQSPVPTNAQAIRCHGCQRIIPTGIKQEIDPIGTNQLSGHEQSNVTINGKGLDLPCMLKLKNKHPNTASSSSEPHPSLDFSQPPPRGKRALLCGVTYKNQKFELKGTIHDVTKIRDLLLERFKFSENSICILTEETTQHPTKKNILEALKWLVRDNQAGDSLVFYFSGHGLRQPDFKDDELDGFDETICPVDFLKEGMILDNEINELIIRPLKPDAKLHAIIDACHSGTVLDLPFVYNKERKGWDDNSPPSGVFKGTSGGLAISFSACLDDQLAADTDAFSEKRLAASGRKMAGAMTYTFVQAVKQNPTITYGELINSMYKNIEEAHRKCLHSHFLSRLFHRNILQEPQLSSSAKFDVNTEFTM
ncbi:unnamed protein product [Ilex paraguariensis]|uniref:Peptidase C14 caspase domain-containing protein n=1 Tax=Ilex paraguariensis TaxID=185542 RepID=A0ABC8T6Q1_9AQUA